MAGTSGRAGGWSPPSRERAGRARTPPAKCCPGPPTLQSGSGSNGQNGAPEGESPPCVSFCEWRDLPEKGQATKHLWIVLSRGVPAEGVSEPPRGKRPGPWKQEGWPRGGSHCGLARLARLARPVLAQLFPLGAAPAPPGATCSHILSQVAPRTLRPVSLGGAFPRCASRALSEGLVLSVTHPADPSHFA